MPAITATSMGGPGPRIMVVTTLNGTDSLTYEQGDILILRNPTGASITPAIDGAGSTTWPAEGIGNINVAPGLSAGAIAAGASITIPMDTVRAFLQGIIAVTSGSGLVGSILRK